MAAQPPPVPSSGAQGSTDRELPVAEVTTVVGVPAGAVAERVERIVATCEAVCSETDETRRVASVAAAKAVLLDESVQEGANAVAACTIVCSTAHPTAVRALCAALVTANGVKLVRPLVAHFPTWHKSILDLLPTLGGDKEMRLAAMRMLCELAALSVENCSSSEAVRAVLAVLDDAANRVTHDAAHARMALQLYTEWLRMAAPRQHAMYMLLEVGATTLAQCFLVPELEVEALRATCLTLDALFRGGDELPNGMQFSLAMTPFLVHALTAAHGNGETELVILVLEQLMSLDISVLAPAVLNDMPEAVKDIADTADVLHLLRFATQALSEGEALAEVAGRMIDAVLTSESREIREVVLEESVVMQAMTESYGVVANRETPADAEEDKTHPAFMVLGSIARAVPALFWATLGGVVLEDMKPEREAAKRVAACVTMAMSLDAISIHECSTTVIERLRHCATAEEAPVRAAGFTLMRQMMFDLSEDEVDYPALMELLSVGIGDDHAPVALQALISLNNMFVEEDEAPEGLADPYIDGIVPKLCVHVSSDNEELRGLAMRVLGLLARHASEAMMPHSALILDPVLAVLRAEGIDAETLGGAMVCLSLMYGDLDEALAADVLPLLLTRVSQAADGTDFAVKVHAMAALGVLVRRSEEVAPDVLATVVRVLEQSAERVMVVEYTARGVAAERSDAERLVSAAVVEQGTPDKAAGGDVGPGEVDAGDVDLSEVTPAMTATLHRASSDAVASAFGVLLAVHDKEPQALLPVACRVAAVVQRLLRHVAHKVQDMALASLDFLLSVLMSDVAMEVTEECTQEQFAALMPADHVTAVQGLFDALVEVLRRDMAAEPFWAVQELWALQEFLYFKRASMLALGVPRGVAVLAALSRALQGLVADFRQGALDGPPELINLTADLIGVVTMHFGEPCAPVLETLVASDLLSTLMGSGHTPFQVAAVGCIAESACGLKQRCGMLVKAFTPAVLHTLATPQHPDPVQRNSAYCLGMFFEHGGAEMEPFLDDAVARLVALLAVPHHPDPAAQDNACSALHRYIASHGSAADFSRAIDAVIAWGYPMKIDHAEDGGAFATLKNLIEAYPAVAHAHTARLANFLAEGMGDSQSPQQSAVVAFTRRIVAGELGAAFWAAVPGEVKDRVTGVLATIDGSEGTASFGLDDEEDDDDTL